VLSVKKKANLKIWRLLAGIIFFTLVHVALSENNSLIKNYGVSFGINGTIFLVLNIFFVLFLWWLYLKEEYRSWGVILVGGMINLIDRIRLGYVNDYWWFFGLYNNLADWLIGIGVLLFVIELLCQKKLK